MIFLKRLPTQILNTNGTISKIIYIPSIELPDLMLYNLENKVTPIKNQSQINFNPVQLIKSK